MGDDGTANIVVDTIVDEQQHFLARLLDGHAVQVETGIEGVFALAQAFEHTVLDAVALVGELIPGFNRLDIFQPCKVIA